MVALRSRRLEHLLGAPLDRLTSENIHNLIGVEEAFDLDFKAEHYGNGDKEKRSLACDVAALANAAGGIIVLGVAEDDQARAAATPGVSLADGEMSRIRQIVAGNVFPHPVFDVITVPGDQPGHGFVVIAVPRSPLAPHAVTKETDLRYPVRSGRTTRYLHEAEVATAYRDRFARYQGQDQRAAAIEQGTIARLRPGESVGRGVTPQPWVVVSLVPDLPGDTAINRQALAELETYVRSRPPTLVDIGLGWGRTAVGHRRLMAYSRSGRPGVAGSVALDAYADGSGVLAMAAWEAPRPPYDGTPPTHQIVDEGLSLYVASALWHLGHHAAHRAGAGGNALVRAQLTGTTRPVMLVHTRGGFTSDLSEEPVAASPPPVDVVVPLDDLAEFGPGLIQAAALLADRLGQAYGVPELTQFTHDGRVRRRYWLGELQGRWAALCARHGVELTDD